MFKVQDRQSHIKSPYHPLPHIPIVLAKYCLNRLLEKRLVVVGFDHRLLRLKSNETIPPKGAVGKGFDNSAQMNIIGSETNGAMNEYRGGFRYEIKVSKAA